MIGLFLALALATAAGETLRLVSANEAVHAGRRTVDVIATAYLIALPLVWAAAAAQGLARGWTWTLAATVGAAASAGANTAMMPLLTWAARHGGMGRASSWLGTTPVVVAALGGLVGDAQPTVVGWAGCAAVAVGVAICNRGPGAGDHPGRASLAGAGAAACGVVAVLAERAVIRDVSSMLFAAVVVTMLAPALLLARRGLDPTASARDLRPLAASPAVAIAGAATAATTVAGLAAVAAGPAWAVVAIKRLSLPGAAVLARWTDGRAGRRQERPQVVLGATLVALGVLAVAAGS
jgi:drug/metabolite transporter (DMT)-like permease